MTEPTSIFDRIRRTRISPTALLVFFVILGGLYFLFTYTNLWYVLVPG